VMDLNQSENLCRKLGNVIDLVKPTASQDFGQVTEDIEGFTVLSSINCLKAGLFQCRLSVAGDYVKTKSGLKQVSGISQTGTKQEVIDWVKYTLPMFISSLKKSADA